MHLFFNAKCEVTLWPLLLVGFSLPVSAMLPAPPSTADAEIAGKDSFKKDALV